MSLDHILRALKLDSGATITKIDATGTLAANSDSNLATQKAVKTYVDAHATAGVDTDGTLAADSDVLVPSQKAVNTFVETSVAAATGAKGVIAFPLSFETNEQMQTLIYFPMKVTVNKIRSTVTKALAGTSNGTITCGNVGGASANGVVTVALSAALEDDDTASPTTNNVVLADGYYYLTTAKADAGGKVLVTLEYTVTA
ncbi:MAG: hypothetical protein WC365_01495 [Candidatus Babeliales bacterium]|jgi:hypothetical protein